MPNQKEMMNLVSEFVDSLERRLSSDRSEPIILSKHQDGQNFFAVFDSVSMPSALYESTILHASLDDHKIYLRGENNAAPVNGAFESYKFENADDLAKAFGPLAQGFLSWAGLAIAEVSAPKETPALAI